jgi:exodeoxyribonuclease VII large subunit
LKEWLTETRQVLVSRIDQRLNRLRQEVLGIRQGYAFRRPADRLEQYIWQIEELTKRLYYTVRTYEKTQKQKINNLYQHLLSLNPKNVLDRGFALVYKEEMLISSEKAVEIDDELLIKLKDGSLNSLVVGKNHG